ncbi:hypothetical protein JK364_13615 [Streptomyces sp. 110]|uniref:Integral membrane protein n=1 Tax=Streptomyces endocoffeicus TaxID=2898945 RepID=A0ABS1PN65_9ACTN|nr:hypothetical protein [Streptomyces endocoffeicus]MBL1113422.1 hypothetical protein [Streptomyces endocoffeicus]
MDPSTDASGPAEPHPLSGSERREYERLRGAAAVRHRRLRHAGACVLLVLAILLSPLAVVATWLHEEITDPHRYVQTVAPIARNPGVQSTVTNRLTKRVVDRVDVPAITAHLARNLDKTGAPTVVVNGTRMLGGPLESALTNAVHRVVHKVITSEQFPLVWDAANRRAHAAVVKVLTGEGTSAVQARGNAIVLDIGTLVDNVKQHLVRAGYEKAAKIPHIDRQFTLVRTDKLDEAQGAMRLLDVVGTWLPAVTIVLAALAVWVSPAHRGTLLAAGVGTAVMMIALLVGLAVVRGVYLDSVPPTTLPRGPAAFIFDTLVRFLRESTRTLLVVAIVTALAAYLYGPGRGARVVRSAAARGTGAIGRGLARVGARTGGFGRWLDTHRAWTTGVVITGGALALVLWNHPTPASVGLVLGIVVGVLALLGILAGASGRAVDGPSASGPATGGPAASGPATGGPATGGRLGDP